MKLFDRAKMTVTGAPGTGSFTLNAASYGFQTFASAGALDGDYVRYMAVDPNGAWEVGWGKYTASGTTLTRNLLLSSTGSLISFTANVVVASAAAVVDVDGGGSSDNMFINGAMEIDQRHAGSSVTPSGGASQNYIIDKWSMAVSQASKMTAGQNLNAITGPTGFKKYLGFQTASAYAVTTSDYFLFYQGIEGFDAAKLLWGTSLAKPFTFGFWIYSTGLSYPATKGATVTNNGFNRSYPFTYTINASGTWEYKVVTIPGDTSGTWATDSSIGLRCNLSLGCGATYTGTPGAWASGNYQSATGDTSVVATLNATLYATGFMGVVGSVPATFKRRPYAQELALCQRYYENSVFYGTAPSDGASDTGYSAAAWSTNGIMVPITFKVEKRAAPTLTFFSGASTGAAAGQWAFYSGGYVVGTGTGSSRTSTKNTVINFTATVTLGTAGLGSGVWCADCDF